jgi:hypothetical protein
MTPMDNDAFASQVTTLLNPLIVQLGELDLIEQVIVCQALNAALLDAQARVAGVRRGAVRRLRGEGFTLRQIADATGVAPQRIHQIEAGIGRKERDGADGRITGP